MARRMSKDTSGTSDATPRSTAGRTIAWAAAGAALLVALAVGARRWAAGTSGADDEPSVAQADWAGAHLVDFPCVESSGKAMRTADLLGHVVVADFMFTSCQAVCPRMADALKEVQSALPPGDDVRIVSFSVDPERDPPGVLAKYADAHGADRKRWLYLHCETDDLKKLMCGELHLANANEPMLHSERFVLFDATGAARGMYRPLDGVEPDWKTRLLADVGKLRVAAR